MKREKTVPGIDSLLKNEMYKGKRIGLITNQTGITQEGVPTWKALLEKGYGITALFGPEHGFRGEAQDAVEIEDTTFLGIKTYSLYGRNLVPTSKMLEEVDILMYDIQDIGSRYYTYLYTLANSLRVCEQREIKFVVLDRPNPVGQFPVEGNSIEDGYKSFVGGYGLTNVYGMTVGEFAAYLKKYFFKNAKLDIIPVKYYSRQMPFEETGLPWVSPSPNIPSLKTAAVYPGTCLFEGTNVSEGRGTTRPFEIIGAPWIDGEKIRESLTQLQCPGTTFSSLFFTPQFSKYKNELCQGVCIHITDRSVYKPLFTGLAVLHTIHALYPDVFTWKRDWAGDGTYFIDRLLASLPARRMLENNKTLEAVYKELTCNTNEFLKKREHVLLYSDI